MGFFYATLTGGKEVINSTSLSAPEVTPILPTSIVECLEITQKKAAPQSDPLD